MGAVTAPRSSVPALWAALVALILALVLSPLLLVVLVLAVDDGGDQGGGPVDGIPPVALALYRAAGEHYGLDWAILAAIGKIETDHGRSTAPGVHSGVNAYGCCAGPMQFSILPRPSTWDMFGVDGNGDGRTDVYDLADAIPAAARYLRASGAPQDYRKAIFSYNHAGWYVDQVLAQAAEYRAADTQAPAGDLPDAGMAARTVLASRRITLTPVQRSDVAAGHISAELLGLLAWIGTRHSVVVTALYSDHAAGTNHRPSDGSKGRAVDIGAVDAHRCLMASPLDPCGKLAIEVLAIRGALHPTEVIACFDPDGPDRPDGFYRADHCDHDHIAFDAR